VNRAADREQKRGVAAGGEAGDGVETAPASGGLLVLVEPPDAEDGPGRFVLAAEGTRLARLLEGPLHLVTWPEGADLDVEALATAAAGLAERTRPAAVLLADTDTGRQLAPMIAYRLGSGCVTACSDVLVRDPAAPAGRAGRPVCMTPGRERTLVFVKPVYGGGLEQEIEPLHDTIPVVALDLTGMDAPETGAAALPVAGVLQVDVTPTPRVPRVRRLEMIRPDPRSVDLVHARRIVTAGAGSAGDALLAAVGELAELLEGSVGATRPVVDDGRLPKERLIGQTGRTVAPDLYVALGLSGSPHHLAGVKRAERILAINKDGSAPIFHFSDVGYVADLEMVLPALVKKIKEWRDASGGPDDSG